MKHETEKLEHLIFELAEIAKLGWNAPERKRLMGAIAVEVTALVALINQQAATITALQAQVPDAADTAALAAAQALLNAQTTPTPAPAPAGP